MLQQIYELENEKVKYQIFKTQIEQLIKQVGSTIDLFEPLIADINNNCTIDSVSADRNLILLQRQTLQVNFEYLNNPILSSVNQKINDVSNAIVQKQRQYEEMKRQEEARRIAVEDARRRAAAEAAAANNDSSSSGGSRNTGVSYSQW